MNKPTSADANDRIDPSVWKIVVVVLIGPFMTQLDSTIVNVSLPAIGQSLGATLRITQWVITGYLLALTLMLPLNAWLVDRFGAKRLYLGCFTAFTTASILCGASPTIHLLIAARILQGLAGGILVPMTQMMIARTAGRQMARVMGLASLPVLVGPIVGPVLAGTLLAHVTWPWLFYVNVPAGIAGVGLAARLLPRDAQPEQHRAFDATGFVLISPGLALLIYGMSNYASTPGRIAIAAGACMLAAFVRHALREGPAALVDVRIYRAPIFRQAAATQFFSNGVLYGRQLLIPLYLITGCALSPNQTGWYIAVMGVGMMCSFPSTGFLVDRFGTRMVSAGGALLAFASMLPFVWMAEHDFSHAWALVSLFCAGAGQGTISIPSVSAAYSTVSKATLPLANTALNIAQRLGGPIATTVLAIGVSLTVHAHDASSALSTHTSIASEPSAPHAFVLAFVILAALHAMALVSALQLPVRVVRAPS
ncbi:DHA2 family efflux MFS transporter permease subunit [Pararobbsia silviterrae]|uniref:DHA2 family efflux MFS transporter permease subunit n=1 Tax=Pararobbsia silviterrae TaxID=1792498 RepID=A0A494XG24_9BURK|nr:DHA2 family efflux MFS transporter permease subunit [Pararobbsia silviterrae]RKP47034.1 DHA2 family efflux MFS transporter permease subunit [Pararobbsia silviterrae]